MREVYAKPDHAHDEHGEKVEPCRFEPDAEWRTAVVGEDEWLSSCLGSGAVGAEHLLTMMRRRCWSRRTGGHRAIALEARKETHRWGVWSAAGEQVAKGTDEKVVCCENEILGGDCEGKIEA
jgi:hypothetical protein